MVLWTGRITTLLLAIALCLSATGGCSSTTDEERTPKPAAVTLHFTNPSATDVYIDVTYGVPYALSHGGTEIRQRGDCTPLCEANCQCFACGAPQPLVRRIPAGGAVDVVWEGDFYERMENACGDGQCSCEAQRFAEYGTYEASLSAALGVIGGTSAANDPDLLTGADVDTSAGSCTAAGSFLLDAQARSVEIAFNCP
jgi:hypothetical protein